MTASDFDSLWNYDDPVGTEAKFRELLPDASAHPVVRLQLLTQIARTQGLQKQYDAAHATLDEVEKALATVDAPVVEVRYLLERGRVLNTSGHPDEAHPLFVRAWDLGREAGAEGFAVDAAHMVAIVEEPEAAIEWNVRALELARTSPDPRAKKWQGSLLNNLGWTYHDRGEFGRALELFQDAVVFREEQGDPQTLRIARWCVARTLRSLGRIDEALEEQRRLEPGATGAHQGYVFEEIAECLHALGRVDEARPYFRRAWEIHSEDPWLPESEPERLERLRRLGEGSAEAGP